MIGRTFSSFEWGKASDRYGRKVVIQASLLLSAVFSIAFGMAPTFELALFWRFVLGLSNGIISSVKTIVSEYPKGDKELETQMMALVLGMWGYGFLICPAISGYLSEPVKQYPDSKVVQSTAFEPLLSAYPFLLPNVLGCIVCLCTFTAVTLYVEETLPEEKRRDITSDIRLWWFQSCCSCCVDGTSSDNRIIRTISSWSLFKHVPFTSMDAADGRGDSAAYNAATKQATAVPKWIRPSPSTSTLLVPCTEEEELSSSRNDTSSGDDNGSVAVSNGNNGNGRATFVTNETVTMSSIWARKSTRQHLVIYWTYSFLVIAIDELFPLFCISQDSGLGVTEKTIGKIFTGTGVCYILFQYFLITGLVRRYGMYGALRTGTMCSIPLAVFVPIALYLDRGETKPDHVSTATYLFLCMVYSVIRVFSSVVFSTVTMATNRTVPTSQRATMNGFSMLGGSVAKALGPAFAGFLFSFSISSGVFAAPYGSVFVFCIVGIMGIFHVVLSFHLKEYYPDEDREPKIINGSVQEQDDADEEKPMF